MIKEVLIMFGIALIVSFIIFGPIMILVDLIRYKITGIPPDSPYDRLMK